MNALSELTRTLAAACTGCGLRVATAESCTGGLIAKLITDLPGSSEWFECGFVTYSNRAKCALLGVPAHMLERHGAVSEATVRAMAEGAVQRCAADVAVAVSGVAGPDGGTPRNPVGSVWLAWAGGGATAAAHHRFEGDRARIREQAAAAALAALLQRVRDACAGR